MPHIVLTANGEEIDRRELTGALVIGRAADCELPVHDILMSRHHCRIEPFRGGWRVVDLKSKNGTRVGWDRADAHVLLDGQLVRAGRTVIQYNVGPFIPAPENIARKKTVRPADPFEALAGTVAGFVYKEESSGESSDADTPASPELAALAEHTSPSPDHDRLIRRRAGTMTLESPTRLGARATTRPMPVPNPLPPDSIARRASYLQRLDDISLQVRPDPLDAPPAAISAAATDWRLVALLLGACVVTLAVAFFLKP